MNRAFIGLGSNLGNRHAMLLAALAEIRRVGLPVSRLSSIYETEPIGGPVQPAYLNMVAEIAGDGLPAPVAFLESLHQIEGKLGRDRRVMNGPRTIDLDLLLYDATIMNHNGVTVPHPRLHERRFVLMPLAEIAPEAIHPVSQRSVYKLLEALVDRSDVSLWRLRD